MLFNDQGQTHGGPVLAISQPAHALISGRILGAWAKPLHEQIVLAGEQHDAAWLDWEVSPTFDPVSGRPHLFRDIGAALHVPMWERGVELALAAWGRRVALLLSLHGSTIYEKFGDRHRSKGGEAKTDDDRAAKDYLRRHRERQADWARVLGLDAESIAEAADLLAFADTLSLILCGALPPFSRLELAGQTVTMTAVPGAADTYRVAPWPFVPDELVFETEARELPATGRFADEASMREWLASPKRVSAKSSLRR